MKPSSIDEIPEDLFFPIVDPEIGTTVPCNFKDCSKCCYETEMMLTHEDLDRIEAAGYDRKEFILGGRPTKEGFWQLKNVDGKCFFLSPGGKCTIYKIRPRGCRLYPLIKTLDTNEIVIDDDCREQEWFENQYYQQEQVDDVHQLVSTLLVEAELENRFR
jgi:uncharacterized protein